MMSTTTVTATCNKSCSYKDCGNSTKNIPLGSDITFFRFPVNPERIFKWKILCGLPAESTPKFICSKHFDSRKYISCNSRRKTLIQTAEPYAYDSEASDMVSEMQDFELIEVENDSLNFDDKNQQYQAIINDALEADSHDEIDLNSSKKMQNIIELTPIKVTKVKKTATIINAPQNNKRNSTPINLNELQNSEVSSKKLKIEIHSEANKNVTDLNIDETSMDVESILKQDEINTFIFKNEEYIQMPRRMFIEHHNALVEQIQAKKLLLGEIEYYKNQLTKIKDIIDV